MKNKVVINGDVAEIHIDSKHGHFITLVDTEDLPRIKAAFTTISIHKSKNGFYARANYKGRLQLLHRFIMNQDDEKIKIDHLDHNTLRNLKRNLRECTQGENLMNSANRGKFPKGVSFNKNNSNYVVKMTVSKGYQKHIGVFDTLEEAAAVAGKVFAERGLTYVE